MNERKLRSIVRKLVNETINEAAPPRAGRAASQVPKTFGAFRKYMAKALRASGAPREMVDLVAAVDDASMQVRSLWDAWQAFQMDIEGQTDPAEIQFIWEESAYDTFHDMVLDLSEEFQNAWNYGPGEGPSTTTDYEAVADRLADYIRSKK